MTYYYAKIIADSSAEVDRLATTDRLTTMEVTFPRFILPEITRHRSFSFSVMSSRARSLTQTIREVEESPFIPDYWGKHQPGMSAYEEVSDSAAGTALWEWIQAKKNAVESARKLAGLGLHKQLVNRILEPFMWTTAIISSTTWENFFNLRISPEAQPEIQRTAQEMLYAFQHSSPTKVIENTWHLPYVSEEEKASFDIEILKKVSAARCARVSYNNQNKIDPEADVKLFDKLVKSGHWSPLEHVAKSSWESCSRNFIGFRQLREDYDGE